MENQPIVPHHGMTLETITNTITMDSCAASFVAKHDVATLQSVAPLWVGLPSDIAANIANKVTDLYIQDTHRTNMRLVSCQLKQYMLGLAEEILSMLKEDIDGSRSYVESEIMSHLVESQYEGVSEDDEIEADARQQEAWNIYVDCVVTYNSYFDAVEHLFEQEEEELNPHSIETILNSRWRPHKYDIDSRRTITGFVQWGMIVDSWMMS